MMKNIHKSILAGMVLSAALLGCGGVTDIGSKSFPDEMITTDDNIQPTDYLAVNYMAVGNSESCTLDSYFSINKNANLYFVSYDVYVNGRNYQFPEQIKLSSHNRLEVSREKVTLESMIKRLARLTTLSGEISGVLTKKAKIYLVLG